ncbi:MAG: YMGG-like glycine zipper-containing protein [Acidocella sp.]|nr:YMGG-like glycine zipper-containing protein [Acidocella sp.]
MLRKLTLRNLTVGLMLTGSLTALAGCGDTTGQRALSGGAIGAGGGAILGAVTGMGAGTGALIGGAAGAVTGAATNKNQINLGN